MSSAPFLVIHPSDTVAVALREIAAGTELVCGTTPIIAQQTIPPKHKFLLQSVEAGEEVRQYGVVVGRTTARLSAGTWLTTTNLKHATDSYKWRDSKQTWNPPDVEAWKGVSLDGYRHEDGRVGIMNYWLVISLVFCENRNMHVLQQVLQEELGYRDAQAYRLYTRQVLAQAGEQVVEGMISVDSVRPVFPAVDGVKFLTHTGGCGGTREDASLLAELLASYANHPNVGGVTVLSLGCQNLQVRDFQAALFRRAPQWSKPLIILEQQQSISEQQFLEDAIRYTVSGMRRINNRQRERVGIDQLCIGVKCGGSDGFSGISANPIVGRVADRLVALGGSVLMAEFPELCGMEQALLDRCVREEVGNRFVTYMEEYARQAAAVGSGFDMNPSPGNIRDGLITDAMKSAGAVQKGGTSPIEGVLAYTEEVINPGLHLVVTPGNDVESTTGLVASGAHLILFTTGLGTPTGNPVAPTVKISSNTALAVRMADIIDVDCGSIITGTESMEACTERLWQYCFDLACGRVTPNAVRLLQDDFIPWKRAISL